MWQGPGRASCRPGPRHARWHCLPPRPGSRSGVAPRVTGASLTALARRPARYRPPLEDQGAGGVIPSEHLPWGVCAARARAGRYTLHSPCRGRKGDRWTTFSTEVEMSALVEVEMCSDTSDRVREPRRSGTSYRDYEPTRWSGSVPRVSPSTLFPRCPNTGPAGPGPTPWSGKCRSSKLEARCLIHDRRGRRPQVGRPRRGQRIALMGRSARRSGTWPGRGGRRGAAPGSAGSGRSRGSAVGGGRR
jgi:hypothetical protein